MKCMDCEEKEATSVIFCTNRNIFYVVCRDCIKKDDYILPYEWTNWKYLKKVDD